MVDWKKIKADIAKGLKEGAETVKDGADIVAKKAGEISAGGRRQLKIFNTKKLIRDHMAELGVAIYEAEKSAPGSVSDKTAQSIIEEIDRANADLLELEAKNEKE